MKRTLCILVALLLLLFCAACIQRPPSAPPATTLAPGTSGTVTISFDFERQSGYSTNQYAVWIGTPDEAVVKTLFATKFTAKGGYEKRPSSLSDWVSRAVRTGITDPDAVAGATPKSGPVSYVWDCTDEQGNAVPAGTYKFFIEFTYRVGEGSTAGRIPWGEIEIGGEDATAQVYEIPAGEPPATNMITNVKAEYTM